MCIRDRDKAKALKVKKIRDAGIKKVLALPVENGVRNKAKTAAIFNVVNTQVKKIIGEKKFPLYSQYMKWLNERNKLRKKQQKKK